MVALPAARDEDVALRVARVGGGDPHGGDVAGRQGCAGRFGGVHSTLSLQRECTDPVPESVVFRGGARRRAQDFAARRGSRARSVLRMTAARSVAGIGSAIGGCGSPRVRLPHADTDGRQGAEGPGACEHSRRARRTPSRRWPRCERCSAVARAVHYAVERLLEVARREGARRGCRRAGVPESPQGAAGGRFGRRGRRSAGPSRAGIPGRNLRAPAPRNGVPVLALVPERRMGSRSVSSRQISGSGSRRSSSSEPRTEQGLEHEREHGRCAIGRARH